MPRARNIKPQFFKNEELVELSFDRRLLFIGLWTLADREGRLEDRPKRIKMEIFPADDVDVDAALSELESGGFIVRYVVDAKGYVQIHNFAKHQNPHHKEVPSEIPPPHGLPAITRHSYEVTAQEREDVFARDGSACLRCGDTENLSLDHIKPLISGGDNSADNLQTLCRRCNSSKGATTKDYRKVNVESTTGQQRVNDGASCPSDSLIPDSLNPDSLSVGENRKRFVPPTIDEVTDYVREKNYPVDPVRFVAFYESNGWKVGKNKMKCWKSAVTGWSTRNDKPNYSGGGAAAPKQTAAQRIAAKRQQLAAQSPDMGVVATDDGDVWPPLEQPTGRGAQRYLASGNS